MSETGTPSPFGWRSFGEGWSVARRGLDPVDVDLPHDAMHGELRDANAPNGSDGAFFPGGTYTYRKTSSLPAVRDGQRAILRFEGVSRVSTVQVDGVEVGGTTNAYREFEVDVTDAARAGGQHQIEVVADNSDQPNSRWYVGSGIHRPVQAQVRSSVSLGPHGVRVVTRSIEGPAEVEVLLDFANPERRMIRAEVALSDGDEVVARDVASTDASSTRMVLEVPDPQPWSAADPHLYRCVVELTVDGELVDHQESRVGLRTVSIHPRRGLLVNGEVVLLRGANIHHDNGVIGSVTLPAAELRRARILKDNGFNAIRSAHNPLSRAMLGACDEVGLYVIDETTDVWWNAKTRYDDARTFLQDWRADLTALVLRDRNHPSVIMYSISNENGETASHAGIEIAQQMTRLIAELDGTRLTTAGVNITLNALASRDAQPPSRQRDQGEAAPDNKVFDSAAFNNVMQFASVMMRVVASTRRADRHTRGVFGVLDVAGYNYGGVRFDDDAKRYPSRMMLGTEDMPGDLPHIWAQVERIPNLVGAFLWAGWDYLGEVGVGHWVYGRRLAPFKKPYPYLTSGSGVIDITGLPGAPALLAQAVWGTARAPGIAVRPLDVAEQPVAKASWRPSDAIASWSWAGREGQVAHVEVFSAADDVELLLNGRSVGHAAAGSSHDHVARFELPYEPGELVARAKGPDGNLVESRLSSARGPLRLTLVPDRSDLSADGDDLAHVAVQVTDADGVVESLADDLVTLTVEGAGTLAGFGSAAPATEESFADHEHHTYYGRALAVVRAPRAAGTMRITATSARHGTATCELHFSDGPAAGLGG